MTEEPRNDRICWHGTHRMIRFWIGTALLAGSWLLGLNYFYPANPYAWLAAVAAGVVLLGNAEQPLAASQLRIAAIVLFLPAVWFASWPYRAAPLLIVLGLAIPLLPHPKAMAQLAGRRRRGCRNRAFGPGVGPGTLHRSYRVHSRSALAAARCVGRRRHAAGNRRDRRRLDHRDALDAASASARGHLGIAARSGHAVVLRRWADDAGLWCSRPGCQNGGRRDACTTTDRRRRLHGEMAKLDLRFADA